MSHIVVDLEMNKIEKQFRGSLKLSSELIEIGAVRLDEDFQTVDTYQSYVLPDYGLMDEHIIRLTGITDEMLVGAPRYAEAMEDFARWIGRGPVQFYSWSLSDIRQIQNESEFKGYNGVILKIMEHHWNDFQEEFSRLLGINKRVRLKQAVASADYTFTGAAHTALADAVNTAEILRLSQNKEEFERVMKPVLDLFRIDRQDNTLLSMCPEFFASLPELEKE